MTKSEFSTAWQTAVAHHAAGRLTEAEAFYEAVPTQDPHYPDATHCRGLIAYQRGQYARAAEFIERAAAQSPTNATIHSNLGEVYRQLGRPEKAVASLQRALTLQPDYPDALDNLGLALATQGRFDEAVLCHQRAFALRPDSATYCAHLGTVLAKTGKLQEATPFLRRAVTLRPDFAEAHYALGSILLDQKQADEALLCFQRVIALRPDFGAAHRNLARLFAAQGAFEPAIASLRRAITLMPDVADVRNDLGRLFIQLHRFDDASAVLTEALATDPHLVAAHNNLGIVHKERGRLNDAISCFQSALGLEPASAEILTNLGNAFLIRGQLDAAIEHYEKAVGLNPKLADVHNNLGTAYKECGRIEDAVAAHRRGLALSPDRADIHSNLILDLLYSPHQSAETLQTELVRWNEQHARPLTAHIKPHTNDRSPNRRLKIGYVSGDFCAHTVGLNLLPLFESHDLEQFDVFCYAHVTAPDTWTKRFRERAHHWRDTLTLSDSALADCIREDRVDILVDLALHTSKNRLLAFAHQPAPVQASFAGYPGHTGLDAIEYHLTDPFLEPAVREPQRKPIKACHLPATFWCYKPGPADPGINPLPALTQPHFTFGCLNNFCKVNKAVLTLWARVMHAVPSSRIFLLSPEGVHRRHLTDFFAAIGIDSKRVRFFARQTRENYLALYHGIDLGLDTFPYNGHTTSLDSYWMGVPVISLVGSTSVGRAGWSQLSNLRLTEFAAHSADEFVAIAAHVARDLPGLARLRASLRARMQQSSLMDAPSFARGIEGIYRTLWQRWCTGTTYPRS